MKSKIISIAHQKGGVGKSTIAFNLAVELSKKYKVSVIDLDFQKSLTIFNEHRKENSLKPLEIFSFDNQNDLINFLKQSRNDIVLIDLGGFDSDLNRTAILLADIVITPVSNSMIEIYGLENFKQILVDLKEIEPEIRSFVLLNNIDPRASKAITELQEYIQNNSNYFKLFQTIIRRRSDFIKAFELGKSVVEMDSKSKASEEIKSLINNIEKYCFNSLKIFIQ